MNTFSFTADKLQEGIRLDTALASKYAQFSRADWSDQVKQGQITINGKVAKSSEKLKSNALVSGTYPQTHTSVLIKPKVTPPVIFEDENVIVINKPAGLVVHPSGKLTQPSVAGAFASEVEDDDLVRPGIVHRLDKDTSGVMILARNPQTKEFLQAQFKARTVQKVYTALIQGHLEAESARIELPLERSKKNPEKMMVSSGGKSAITEYQTITQYDNYTLVEIKLHTGRTHQIRAQFAHIGNPIVGDRLYAQQDYPKGLTRQFLHASSLSIEIAPGVTKKFSAPLAKELKEFLDSL